MKKIIEKLRSILTERNKLDSSIIPHNMTIFGVSGTAQDHRNEGSVNASFNVDENQDDTEGLKVFTNTPDGLDQNGIYNGQQILKGTIFNQQLINATNISSDKIKEGNTIFGINGTLKDYSEIEIDTYNWMYIPKLTYSNGVYKYSTRYSKTFPLVNITKPMSNGDGFIIIFNDDGIYLYVSGTVSKFGQIDNNKLILNEFKEYVLVNDSNNKVLSLDLDPIYINEWEMFNKYTWKINTSSTTIELDTTKDIYGVLNFVDGDNNIIIKGQAITSHVLSGQICSALIGGTMEGTMPNNGEILMMPASFDQSIPSGYTSGGTVFGDENLTPENIKKGVSIFDTEGTLKSTDKNVFNSITIPKIITDPDDNYNVYMDEPYKFIFPKKIFDNNFYYTLINYPNKCILYATSIGNIDITQKNENTFTLNAMDTVEYHLQKNGNDINLDKFILELSTEDVYDLQNNYTWTDGIYYQNYVDFTPIEFTISDNTTLYTNCGVIGLNNTVEYEQVSPETYTPQEAYVVRQDGTYYTGNLKEVKNGESITVINTHITKTEESVDVNVKGLLANKLYRLGSKINIPNNILANKLELDPSNIKSGESILGIQGTLEPGIDTSDADATANNIEQGKTAYVNGNKITGNINTITSSLYFSNCKSNDLSVGYINFILEKTLTSDTLFKKNSLVKLGISTTDLRSKIGLTSSKIKKGETILGLTGTYEGVKLPFDYVENVSELDNKLNKQVGDFGLVYSNIKSNILPESIFNKIYLSDDLYLPDYKNILDNEGGEYGMMQYQFYKNGSEYTSDDVLLSITCIDKQIIITYYYEKNPINIIYRSYDGSFFTKQSVGNNIVCLEDFVGCNDPYNLFSSLYPEIIQEVKIECKPKICKLISDKTKIRFGSINAIYIDATYDLPILDNSGDDNVYTIESIQNVINRLLNDTSINIVNREKAIVNIFKSTTNTLYAILCRKSGTSTSYVDAGVLMDTFSMDAYKIGFFDISNINYLEQQLQIFSLDPENTDFPYSQINYNKSSISYDSNNHTIIIDISNHNGIQQLDSVIYSIRNTNDIMNGISCDYIKDINTDGQLKSPISIQNTIYKTDLKYVDL